MGKPEASSENYFFIKTSWRRSIFNGEKNIKNAINLRFIFEKPVEKSVFYINESIIHYR